MNQFGGGRDLHEGEETEETEAKEPRVAEHQGISKPTQADRYFMRPNTSLPSPAFNLNRARLPDLTGPSIYEEQAQALDISEDIDQYGDEGSYITNGDFADYNARDECDDDGWVGEPEGLPGEFVLGEYVEPSESCEGEEGRYVAKPVEESHEVTDDVVSSNFWRPHKLY